MLRPEGPGAADEATGQIELVALVGAGAGSDEVGSAGLPAAAPESPPSIQPMARPPAMTAPNRPMLFLSI